MIAAAREEREDVLAEFLNPRHRLRFLWGYVARLHLLRAIQPFAASARGSVLDVGCGRQPYRSLFRAARCYVGSDVPGSPHQREHTTVLFDGERLPFREASFDDVLCSEVVEHAASPEALLAEIRRVLVPGGRLLLTTPFVFPHHEAPHDLRRYTRFGLERLASTCGFEGVRVRPLGGYAAAVAHVLGLFAMHRLNRFYLRYWVYPLVWAAQEGLLVLDRLDRHPDQEFSLGWCLTAVKPSGST